MQFQSQKTISQKKFKDISIGISLYGIISFLLVFFMFKTKIGIMNAFIFSADGILVFVLGLIIYKTKSKIAVILLLLFLVLATAFSVFDMIESKHFSVGGIIIKLFLISAVSTLFTHIKNINNNEYDTFSASLRLTNDEQWNELKKQLEDQYKADGFIDKKKEDERFFKIRKDDTQFIQMSRNQQKCDILIVADKQPILAI